MATYASAAEFPIKVFGPNCAQMVPFTYQSQSMNATLPTDRSDNQKITLKPNGMASSS